MNQDKFTLLFDLIEELPGSGAMDKVAEFGPVKCSNSDNDEIAAHWVDDLFVSTKASLLLKARQIGSRHLPNHLKPAKVKLTIRLRGFEFPIFRFNSTNLSKAAPLDHRDEIDRPPFWCLLAS